MNWVSSKLIAFKADLLLLSHATGLLGVSDLQPSLARESSVHVREASLLTIRATIVAPMGEAPDSVCVEPHISSFVWDARCRIMLVVVGDRSGRFVPLDVEGSEAAA